MYTNIDRTIEKLMLAEIEHSFEILRDLKIDTDMISLRHFKHPYSEIGLELSSFEIAEIFFKLNNINEISVNELMESDSNFLAYIESKKCFVFATESELKELFEDCWAFAYGVGSIGTALEGSEIGELECDGCGKYFMIDEDCYRISADGLYLCESCHAERFKTEREWTEYILLGENISIDEAEIKKMKQVSDETINLLCSILMEQNGDTVAYYTTAW